MIPTQDPTMNSSNTQLHDVEQLMGQLRQIVETHQSKLDEANPLARVESEYLHNNWVNCRDGLLKRTSKIRVWPEPSPAPRSFHFEVDCPFKSKNSPDSPVQLQPGPVRGNVIYRYDLFEHIELPSVAVVLDPEQSFFHPNYSRQFGVLCLGNLPEGPLALDALLPYMYSILTYDNRHPAHAADKEAAYYFGFDPDAMTGLVPAQPLY